MKLFKKGPDLASALNELCLKEEVPGVRAIPNPEQTHLSPTKAVHIKERRAFFKSLAKNKVINLSAADSKGDLNENNTV